MFAQKSEKGNDVLILFHMSMSVHSLKISYLSFGRFICNKWILSFLLGPESSQFRVPKISLLFKKSLVSYLEAIRSQLLSHHLSAKSSFHTLTVLGHSMISTDCSVRKNLLAIRAWGEIFPSAHVCIYIATINVFPFHFQIMLINRRRKKKKGIILLNY